MTYALRRALAAIVGILVLGWIVSGCSGSTRDSGAVGTTGEIGSAITIETSSQLIYGAREPLQSTCGHG